MKKRILMIAHIWDYNMFGFRWSYYEANLFEHCILLKLNRRSPIITTCYYRLKLDSMIIPGLSAQKCWNRSWVALPYPKRIVANIMYSISRHEESQSHSISHQKLQKALSYQHPIMRLSHPRHGFFVYIVDKDTLLAPPLQQLRYNRLCEFRMTLHRDHPLGYIHALNLARS